MIDGNDPDKHGSAKKESAEPSRKREDLLKQTANSRKFKKDSIIFGIPVKNNSKTINATLHQSNQVSTQKKN